MENMKIFKISLLLLFTLTVGVKILAHEKSAFKVDGVDLSFGGYLVEHKVNQDSESSNYGGNITLGITTSFNDNLFTLEAGHGEILELVLVSGEIEHKHNFINLMYGRRFFNKAKFRIEGYLGFGYYHQKRILNNNFSLEKTSDDSLALPIDLRLYFFMSPKIDLGLNPEVNFNTLNTYYGLNISLRYKIN